MTMINSSNDSIKKLLKEKINHLGGEKGQKLC